MSDEENENMQIVVEDSEKTMSFVFFDIPAAALPLQLPKPWMRGREGGVDLELFCTRTYHCM